MSSPAAPSSASAPPSSLVGRIAGVDILEPGDHVALCIVPRDANEEARDVMPLIMRRVANASRQEMQLWRKGSPPY